MIRTVLFVEAREGDHGSPVRVFNNHTAAAAGDQPIDLLRYRRLWIARIIGRTHDDRRALASFQDNLLNLPAKPASLRTLVADSHQKPCGRLASGAVHDRDHSAVHLSFELLAGFKLV